MQYWIGRNGQKLGPYTIEDLRGMASNGGAVASDLVWSDGMPNWVPLYSIVPPAAPMPPPPPQQQQAWQQPQQQQQMPMGMPMPNYQMAAPMPMQMGMPAGNMGPMPPNLHWAAVLGISYVTGGIFQLYWMFKEANFVKKLDQSSRALGLLIAGFMVPLICGVLILGLAVLNQTSSSTFMRNSELQALMMLLIVAAGFGSMICSLMAIFQMRSSIQNYYNSVEPIGLRLSGVMTFFFNVLYFQHHFSRIARWKMTGFLEPQG